MYSAHVRIGRPCRTLFSGSLQSSNTRRGRRSVRESRSRIQNRIQHIGRERENIYYWSHSFSLGLMFAIKIERPSLRGWRSIVVYVDICWRLRVQFSCDRRIFNQCSVYVNKGAFLNMPRLLTRLVGIPHPHSVHTCDLQNLY